MSTSMTTELKLYQEKEKLMEKHEEGIENDLYMA